MIIDCTIFNNEFDMLESRLAYLYDHVDYFVVCESNMTFSGNRKPMYFLENSSRYSAFLDKVLYCPRYLTREPYLNSSGEIDSWKIESEQRNDVVSALRNFPDDVIIINSDLDEIPNHEVFGSVVNKLQTNFALRLEQDLYFYDLQCKLNYPHPWMQWKRPVATTKRHALDYGLDNLRSRNDLLMQENGGWHLSYFMSAEMIRNKIESFSHSEVNDEKWKSAENLKSSRLKGTDMFGWNITSTTPSRESFPDSFIKVFGKYYEISLV